MRVLLRCRVRPVLDRLSPGQRCSIGSTSHSVTTSHGLGAAAKKYIPEPSWSIASLALNQPRTPISTLELERLAKRAVLDLSRIPNNPHELCQDLGNMLHLMNQVQDFVTTYESTHESSDTEPLNDAAQAALLYDVPRGVTQAPVQDGSATSDEDVSRAVRTSFWAPNLQRVGGHEYFEIVTGRAGDTNGTH